jgi:hypothetical protein
MASIQLESASSKQSLQMAPETHGKGALLGLLGNDAYLVPLWALLNTTWASQLLGHDAPSA